MALSWGLGHPPQSMALPLHVRGLEARHPRNLTLKLIPWRPKSQGQVLIHGLCVTVFSELPNCLGQECSPAGFMSSGELRGASWA